jgi:hypothetical protein
MLIEDIDVYSPNALVTGQKLPNPGVSGEIGGNVAICVNHLPLFALSRPSGPVGPTGPVAPVLVAVPGKPVGPAGPVGPVPPEPVPPPLLTTSHLSTVLVANSGTFLTGDPVTPVQVPPLPVALIHM